MGSSLFTLINGDMAVIWEWLIRSITNKVIKSECPSLVKGTDLRPVSANFVSSNLTSLISKKKRINC